VPRIDADSVKEHNALLQQRVFDAFATLMAERSFDAVTMAALAERAGLGRTSIYHHFADREAVLVAFASHETAAYVDQLRTALESAADPVAELRTYVRHQLDAGEQFHMGLGRAVAAHLSEQARLEIREHVLAVEDVLRGILGRGAEAGLLVVDDVDATIALVHSCLGARGLPPATVESFVLRAVGAGQVSG